MAIRSFQRSIRFSESEWDGVTRAAEKAGTAPGTFVRKAAAREAQAEALGSDDSGTELA